MIAVEVYLWGTRIGFVVQKDETSVPVFEYDSVFVKTGIELSPLMMPLKGKTYSFPTLSEETFRGLPGMLADSLPDKFGTRVIEDYLVNQGRSIESLTAVERLCYIGKRGMGALEYEPQKGDNTPDQTINIDEMAKLADEILSERHAFTVNADSHAMKQLIEVGTSAGGARAKVLIAWNEKTGDIRSGQIDAGTGYSYWLLKFGNIQNNKDKDKEADSKEYTRIEYAYSLMAKAAKINMTECRLVETKEGTHFATKRFDREEVTGRKLHMQSLGGIAHFDFNDAGAHSYEQAAMVMRKLKLLQTDMEQLFRRMVFNEVTKNYDDHVKNISFLMDRKGKWTLAPAYDMTYAYTPNSIWTAQHQMKINGKRNNISKEDMLMCGRNMDLSDKKAKDILEQVIFASQDWTTYAEEAGVSEKHMEEIKRHYKYNN
ncbi:MAG: type II toxin-antitoxin system HipA family toxin [Lachnospiraceae bacterium]